MLWRGEPPLLRQLLNLVESPGSSIGQEVWEIWSLRYPTNQSEGNARSDQRNKAQVGMAQTEDVKTSAAKELSCLSSSKPYIWGMLDWIRKYLSCLNQSIMVLQFHFWITSATLRAHFTFLKYSSDVNSSNSQFSWPVLPLRRWWHWVFSVYSTG